MMTLPFGFQPHAGAPCCRCGAWTRRLVTRDSGVCRGCEPAPFFAEHDSSDGVEKSVPSLWVESAKAVR